MKAFEIQKGFGLQNLKICERADPEPGPGQVLIHMRSCSLNYRDLLMVKGLYNPKQPLPLVPCSDGVGEVVAVGQGTTRVKIGDRVAGCFLQKWIAGEFTPEARGSTLGGPLDGMLGELALLSQDGVVKVPAHLSDDEAATLPCAALTAWNALFVRSNLQPGESVLLQGTGGVSLFGLQFARMAGARTIVFSSSAEKLERVRALGANETINTRSDPDWDRKVRDLTGGNGVDAILDVGGGSTFARSLNAVRFGGSVCVIGVLGGASAEIGLTNILMKGTRISGVFVGSRTMFEQMNRAVAANLLKPVIDRVFPFAEAPQAFAHLESGKHLGKIVLRF